MEGIKYRITGMSGGSKRNAIPREAEVTLLIYPEDSKDVKTIIRDFVEDTLLEFQKNDGGLKVVFKRKKTKVKNVYGKKFTKKLIKNILALPHGIIAMSPDIPDLVETSTNLATVSQEGTGLRIGSSQRSSIESAKVNIANTVKVVLDLGGASEIFSGDGYPGWQPNMDSELLKVSQDVYFNMYAKLPEIKAIHAGLECGLLGAKYPGLDMISFGPTIHGAHSPDEKVNIEDVNRFYTLLKNILKVYTA
jgi:dipeptidase D